ncbi:MAG: Wzz/FepE/Etk N-terminal domain-containing protein [Flavobacteriia bacterium]|jgi:tyrosine-protein kinase Etk/Wzc
MTEQVIELEKERQNLLIFIWRKRKILTIVTGAAGVVSLIVSLLMTPIYRSTAVVFPAATSTVSFSEQRNAKAAAMDFGEEEHAEQLVQILSSSRIRDKIVEEFNLMKHYEIDANDANKHYKLVKAYNNHFLFVRTRYGSIQIDVLDRDPKLAAAMANKVVELIDTVKNAMVAERTFPAFEVNKRKLQQLIQDRDAVLAQLDSLSALGVVSLDGRTNLYQAYVDSKSAAEKAEIKRLIDVNIEFGSLFDGLEFIRNEKIMKLEEFMVSYEQAESDANAVFNHKFVVERAVVADKKDKPKRLIVVLLSTMGAFVFMVFALLIADRLKELKKIA